MRRPGTRNEQFIQRIPSDIIDRIRGTKLLIPVGDRIVTKKIGSTAQDIRLSLSTSDPKVVKERHAQVSAALAKHYAAARQGPRRLSPKETVALAGIAYRIWVDAFDDDPGPPGLWDRAVAANEEVIQGLPHRDRLRLTPATPEEKRMRLLAALERRFGPVVDVVLGREGLVVDEDSRSRLLMQVAEAMQQATKINARKTKGDYRPDPDAARFPEWEPPRLNGHDREGLNSASVGKKVTLTSLVEGWWREAKATGRSISTHQSYSTTVDKLAKFLGHNDARRVTPEDIVRFKDYRLSEVNPKTGKPVSPKTVKDSDLAGLKAVFGWAVSNRLLPSNPAEGITIKLGKPKRVRSKGFTDAEAQAILKAASELQRGKETLKTFAAKRWVPWLCAYTGSRVGEMAQLRKQDLRQQSGIWVLTVTPEAGTVKGGQAREIPLHPHLVELGFPTFVMSAPDGHLFLNPNDAEPDPEKRVLGPLQGVKNRLQEFARKFVPDRNVAPNHGWRHRFKTLWREVGLDPRIMDQIQGHAARTVGDEYGDVTIKAMASALAKFPRQGVDCASDYKV